MGLLINSDVDLCYLPTEAAYRLFRGGEVSQPFSTQFEAKRAFERRSVHWKQAQ